MLHLSYNTFNIPYMGGLDTGNDVASIGPEAVKEPANVYQANLDKKTKLIFDEYTDKFQELSPSVKMSYSQNPDTGRYDLQFEANGKVEKIQVPEATDGFKFASVADMLNIIYSGIETKGSIFQNQKADALTELGRWALWDEAKYLELPFNIVINNQIVFKADKKENPAKFELGRKIETLCKNLVS